MSSAKADEENRSEDFSRGQRTNVTALSSQETEEQELSQNKTDVTGLQDKCARVGQEEADA